MVRPSPPRIEWSPDGERFVTRLPDERIRMHRADGSLVRGLGRALDARWDGNDRVISIDSRGDLRWHGPIGVDAYATTPDTPIHAAWFAPGGRAVATLSTRQLAVAPFGARKATWILDRARHGLPSPDQLAVVLSFDGAQIAIAYTSHGATRGRGFVVIELASDRELARDFVAIDGLVDAPAGLAFDRATTRLVATHPERFPAVGVIDLTRGATDDEVIRAHLGGARAVAIDERGMIAAYAYPGRLVFEFLAPASPGGIVSVESELAFETLMRDVIAIGFDPNSRWLACLASTGTIEIVPVP